jgi:carboxyl-terminal processing protease
MDKSTNLNNNPFGFLRHIVLAALGLILASLIYVAGIVTGLGIKTVQWPSASQQPIPPLTFDTVSSNQPQDVDFGVFWEVWNAIETRFYYDLPQEDVRMYGAIDGLLKTLDDPYTGFVTPDVARILREDNTGTFEGIGAYVEEAPEGGVHLIRVFEDSPAEKAGLLSGDVIVAVDGQDITDMILNEALLLIRGPAGTEVTLTVFREGETELLDFTAVRGEIEIPTVETKMLEGDIGYVALFEFNSRSSARLEAATEDLIKQGAKSLILDLRNNPGGFLDQSVNVADLFLAKGLVLIQRDVDGNVVEHTSRNGDPFEDIPLVVLINGNSASASEIVAGAIQDRQRGTLIGETSFGKGSVQLLFDLSDGSQLRVTYANWFTPNDNSISAQGITPDIIVETPTEPTGTDIQLERAVEFLSTGQ